MKCPVDATPLELRYVERTPLSLCPTCWGIWFDGASFKETVRKILWGQLSEEQRQALAGSEKPSPPESHLKERRFTCPKDYHPMDRYPYAGNSKVIIDRCESCEGFWLDGYEILRLWEHLKPDTVLDIAAQRFVKDLQKAEEERRALARFPLDQLQFVFSFFYPIPYLSLILGTVTNAIARTGIDLTETIAHELTKKRY